MEYVHARAAAAEGIELRILRSRDECLTIEPTARTHREGFSPRTLHRDEMVG